MDELEIMISGEDGDLGERFKDFAIKYTVTLESDSEITVTETVGSSVIRTHTVMNGEEQSAAIPVKGLVLGQHTVTITASAGDAVAVRTYTFSVPPVWIDCEKTDLGDKKSSFAVDYVPGSYSGEEVTVTEFLDGKQQRSYTAASGELQSMAIDMRNVVDGDHRVSITAQGGEDTTATEIVFRAAVIVSSGGGTVQELQDETGAPVFPVTLAKATLMTDGRSVEGAIFDVGEEINAVDQRAVNMELLWANASPGSAFGAQTVSLDLTDYDFVLIECIGPVLCEICAKGRSRTPYEIVGFERQMECIVYRTFTVSDTGVTFSGGYYRSSFYQETKANDGYIIPQKIYGIKKVKK